MELRTYESWSRELSPLYRPSVDLLSFSKTLIIEHPSGKLYSADEWNANQSDEAKIFTEQDVKFWYDVICMERDYHLKDYFSRRIALSKDALAEISDLLSFKRDYCTQKATSLISKCALVKLVRHLHWHDLCDTPVTQGFTEKQLVECVWVRGHVPSRLLCPSRKLHEEWLRTHFSLFTDKASIFPPEVIGSIIRHDLDMAKSLFCPVVGWSSYLLGFVLSRCAGHFVGVDANPKNVAVLHKLAYEGLRLPVSNVQILQGKTETVDPSQLQIPSGGFEGIFFSPPYYNRERYFGADQSHLSFPNYNAWKEGFYGPLFVLCAQVIDPKKGRMAVVVSDQTVDRDFYPLVMDTILLASRAGFKFISYRYLTIAGARSARKISKEPHEVLCLFSF